MYNLEELQQNLKLLVKEFQEIKLKSKTPLMAHHQNISQPLIKIPKAILLAKVCPYLTLTQIISLSSTCTSLRRAVYGPLGWKILSFQLTKCPVVIKQIFPSQKKNNSFEPQHFSLSGMESQDQKYLKKERTKYKQILTKKYDNYVKSKERFEGHSQKLRAVKNEVLKKKFQNIFLQKNRQNLENGNSEYKQKLKSLSKGFSQKITRLDNQLDQLLKDNTKLQNQKEALAGKVREYQFDIERVKIDSQKSKQILKKLKNYLLYKQL